MLQDRIEEGEADLREVAERMPRMVAEIERMEALIRHLLEVSTRGELVLSAEGIDPLVAGVLRRLEGLASQRKTIVRFAGGSDRLLHLDRIRIERAIENLVRNAIEAAAEGGGNVSISTRDDPHSTVIVVDDDGPGIRPEDRSQVFLLHTTSKRGGTGLGLPLAQEDISRHGGAVEVLSRPGGGARFVVHLPLEVPGTRDVDPARRDVLAPPGEAVPRSGEPPR